MPLALTERLRRTFATRQEVDEVGENFTALQSLYLQVRESADEAGECARAAALEHLTKRLDRADTYRAHPFAGGNL